MHKFIFAILSTFVVVVFANKDLMNAIAEKNLWLVKFLLLLPWIDVHYTTFMPCYDEPEEIKITNPLLRALEFDPFDEVAEGITMAIIQAGADPNAAYINGGRALHMACTHGCIKVVKELLDRNADIEAVHPRYGTSLNVAIEYGRTELALFLIKNYKPDLEAKTPKSLKTPLQQACDYGIVAVVEALLDKNVNLEAVDSWGKTAVHIAAAEGNVEILTILRKKGANFKFGKGVSTPLHEAVKRRNGNSHPEKNLEAAIALIESFDVDINATDEDGCSPLYIATAERYWPMILMLMAHGADQHLKGYMDVSPNDMALKTWKKDLESLYLRYKSK